MNFALILLKCFFFLNFSIKISLFSFNGIKNKRIVSIFILNLYQFFEEMNKFRFRCLASGSSGNCYFLGNASYGILIDSGVSVRNIKRFLKTMGLDFENIWGVFITHDHTDHIKSVGVLGEKYNLPIFTTEKIHEGINRNYRVTEKLTPKSQRVIQLGENIDIGEFTIKAFPVSHDSSECVGYQIKYNNKVFSLATDLGYVSLEAEESMLEADYIVLEANYDEEMLKNGPYPLYLQNRIKSDWGHLSNQQAADFLTRNYQENWKYIFLCHLSKDNNMPDTAYNTVKTKLLSVEKDIEEKTAIIPLERTKPSSLYIFD